MIDPWCNGNTADFGSVVPGSSPGGSTKGCGREIKYKEIVNTPPQATEVMLPPCALSAPPIGDSGLRSVIHSLLRNSELTRGVMVTLQILDLPF